MKALVLAASVVVASLAAAPAMADSIFGGFGAIGAVGGLTGSASGANSWTQTQKYGNGQAQAGTVSEGVAKSGLGVNIGNLGTGGTGLFGVAASSSVSGAATSSTGNGGATASTGGNAYGATGSIGGFGVLGGGFVNDGNGPGNGGPIPQL